jgi:hypothetical protein
MNTDDIKKLTGSIVVIGCGDKTSIEYLKLVEIAREKNVPIITSEEAHEAGLNIVPVNHLEIRDIPIPIVDDEIINKYNFPIIYNKRGKGKKHKRYEPPYKYHR